MPYPSFPNIDPWGPAVFVWLLHNIEILRVLQSPYDKKHGKTGNPPNWKHVDRNGKLFEWCVLLEGRYDECNWGTLISLRKLCREQSDRTTSIFFQASHCRGHALRSCFTISTCFDTWRLATMAPLHGKSLPQNPKSGKTIKTAQILLISLCLRHWYPSHMG